MNAQRSRLFPKVSPIFSPLAALLVLAACAAPAPRAEATPLASRDNPYGRDSQYEVEVLVDGAAAPQFLHAGDSYVLGRNGARYTLRVWNRSWTRVEAVVSVDGLDVIDGKTADFREKRGYVIAPGGFVDIEGWRLSGRQAAAFRFSTVRDSYAARTGGARNVGVIGVAVFPERPAPVAWPELPRPYPQPRPWPPRRWYESLNEGVGRDKSAKASDGAPPPAAEPASAPTADAARSGSAAPAPRTSESAPGKSAGSPAIGSLSRPSRQRPGLGTSFGESVESPVEQVAFVRADRATPSVMLGLRYNDRAGLLAIGIDVDGVGPNVASDQELRRSADPFPASDRAYASPPPGWRR
jgi:hypothetical protein